jgi:hypothetical protein
MTQIQIQVVTLKYQHNLEEERKCQKKTKNVGPLNEYRQENAMFCQVEILL